MRTELNTRDTFSEFACLTFSYLAELLESPIVAMSGRSTEDSVAAASSSVKLRFSRLLLQE